MRVPLVLRMSLMAAAFLASIGVAGAGAPGNPGSGTSGPPVPLGADQMRAIAAKGVPQTPVAPAPAPLVRTADGKMVPAISTPPAPPAGAAPHRPLRLPTISPAIGEIPRAEWGHPSALPKQPDIAVIGSQRIEVGAARAEAGAPAPVRTVPPAPARGGQP